MTTFDKIKISPVNDMSNGVIRKHYDTLPVISVDKKTAKTITAKDVNFFFVGTFTKQRTSVIQKRFYLLAKDNYHLIK